MKGKFLVEKFEGKGGWTYVRMPDFIPKNNTPFGWQKVTGKVDDFDLGVVKLMPMGDGSLFLPLKAAIRKKIKKEAGDFVFVALEAVEDLKEVTNELRVCLEQDPDAQKFFDQLPLTEQLGYVNWIYDVKTSKEKEDRIVSFLRLLNTKVSLRK